MGCAMNVKGWFPFIVPAKSLKKITVDLSKTVSADPRRPTSMNASFLRWHLMSRQRFAFMSLVNALMFLHVFPMGPIPKPSNLFI